MRKVTETCNFEHHQDGPYIWQWLKPNASSKYIRRKEKEDLD